MSFQTVFKRYELKYLLTEEQRNVIYKSIDKYMKPDSFGHTTVRNIYYDTDNYLLVRTSNDKPVYKEKLRLRSYYKVLPNESVFAELKKKYKSVVYKRRAAIKESAAVDWFDNGIIPADKSQINDEIDYFRRFYGTLSPKVFLSYERDAFFAKDETDFRITFDNNILARTDNLSLCYDTGGYPLLNDGYTLMEIKVSAAIPLWMVKLLTENSINKISFSKYGTAYNNLILSKGVSYNVK